MQTDEDCHTVLGRLENAVTAARDQAAPDECYIGETVKAGQLADGVDEEHAAGEALALPIGALEKVQRGLPKLICYMLEALRVTRGEKHYRGRMLSEDSFEGVHKERLFTLDGASTYQHRTGS